MGSWPASDYDKWRIGHTFWLYLESTGYLKNVLRMDSRKPYVRVKAARA